MIRPDVNLLETASVQPAIIAAAEPLLDAAATPGASLALVLNGRPVVVAGLGFADLARSTRLAAGAQFYIYSVTKSLIAAAILQLVDQGRVVLDAPVQAYLTGLPFDEPVTIRQLLNHTGGLPDYGALAAYSQAVQSQPATPWSADEYLAVTLEQGFVFPPGQGWRYSNIGFLLLKQLLERVTAASFQAALHQGLFAPLGLQHTFAAASLADSQHLTPGFSSFFGPGDALQNVAPLYHPGWVSHGVVISTVGELAQVFEALFDGRLLRADLLAQMLEPIRLPLRHALFRQPAYGLGLMIDAESPYGLVAGHAGGGPGYSAAALHFSALHGQRVTSVALANRDQPDLGLQIAFAAAVRLADFLRPLAA